MIKRIVEISRPSYLYIKLGQLCIRQNKEVVGRVALEDLGVLLLAHPAISLSQAVLYLAVENNTVIVLCDQKYQPISLMLPLSGHSLHARILKEQIAFSVSKQKSAWAQIIQAKIQAQAENLRRIQSDHEYLMKLVTQVKSGDPDNKEAQAAQYYWKRYMGDQFRRNPDLEDENILLNYGYAILRAAVARAIVCSGLHPSLGIFHRNLYNSFALADDLMEPLRPKVDDIVQNLPKNTRLDAATRTIFLEMLAEPVEIKKQIFPLMVALHHYTASFKSYMTGESKKIDIPK